MIRQAEFARELIAPFEIGQVPRFDEELAAGLENAATSSRKALKFGIWENTSTTEMISTLGCSGRR